MDILFQNEFRRTPKDFHAFYRYCFFGGFQIAIELLLDLIIIVLMILCIVAQTFSFVLLAAPIYYLFFIVLYATIVQTKIRRDARLSQGHGVLITATVTDTHLRLISSPGETILIELSALRKVSTVKHLILLRTETSRLYFLRQDSFTVGDTASFLEFLKEKGIKCPKR